MMGLTQLSASRRGNAANPTNYTKFGMLKMREEFRRNPPINLSKMQRGSCEGDFAACISLYHAYELLLQHGMRAFFNFISKVNIETTLRQLFHFSLGGWLVCLPNYKVVWK